MNEAIHIRTIRDDGAVFLEIALPGSEPSRYRVKAPGEEGNKKWTQPENWGPVLECAEHRFGPRDRDYALLGVALSDTAHPKLFYRSNNRGFVPYDLVIGLGDPQTEICGLWGLAHECIHALTPTPAMGEGVTVIEEGLATVFSRQMVEHFYGVPNWGLGNGGSYDDAAAEVEDLLKRVPHAIRKLRAIEPCFRNWTADTFAKALPEIDDQLVSRLLAPWVRVIHPNPTLETWAEANAARR